MLNPTNSTKGVYLTHIKNKLIRRPSTEFFPKCVHSWKSVERFLDLL